MMNADLFAPVVAHFVLWVVLGAMMGPARIYARASGKTKGRSLSLGEQNWPGRVQQISSAFNNQFETPIYFYAVIGFAMLAQYASGAFIALAWGYVASRIVHALIYITVNIVPVRFLVFLAGLICLIAMWALLALQVLGG